MYCTVDIKQKLEAYILIFSGRHYTSRSTLLSSLPLSLESARDGVLIRLARDRKEFGSLVRGVGIHLQHNAHNRLVSTGCNCIQEVDNHSESTCPLGESGVADQID